MSNTFKQFIINSYDAQELQEIAEHGCASGCAHGLIYYSDTVKAYEEHKDSLHAMLQDYKDNFGEWPSYITDNLGDYTQFANTVVWLCAEIVAQETVNA